ncbi:hypothetical protein A3F57_06325 [Candidatus Roizmanbacteria bacterium RIFCSPHIGHO2_12_FULL_36_11]|nr:MAG: hypothetical protein A3F57_06325 [Candidatus Roizmanbacteria bacterium RIFCSPHIGHO2_12_FULL_36_11]
MQKIFFKSKDGQKLCGIWHIPSKPTTKAVVLAHGMTVDKDEEGIFIELAELLKKNGYAVFRFDFRGHGESEGKSIDTTITGEMADVEAAVKEVKLHEYKEIGLLGASVGGGTATLYAEKNQRRLRCFCLWNPALNFDHTFLDPITSWLKNRHKEMMNDLKTKGWTMVGSSKKVYGRKMFEEMAKFTPYKALRNISLPTVIIHGTKDKYVPYEDAKTYVKYLKNGKLITLKNGEHGFQEKVEDRKKAKQETLKFFLKYL